MKTGLIALLLIMPLTAHAAAAKPVRAEVQVEWRHNPRQTFIIDERVWHCDGNACTGYINETPMLKMRTCRAIARLIGGVTQFSSAAGPFEAEELERCNEAAPR